MYDISGHECIWWLDGVTELQVSLQELNPTVTPITSYKNVVPIENTASTLFVALWIILTFREIKIKWSFPW